MPPANIHTLKDLDSGPSSSGAGASGSGNAQPMPNPWAGGGSGAGGGGDGEQQQAFAADGAPHQQQQQMGGCQPQVMDPFWTYNLPPDTPPGWHHCFINICYPCCVGNPCSDVRKQDYKRAITKFVVIAAIIQILYFIVELSVGGFAPADENPSLGPPSHALRTLGAKYGPDIRYKFQLWRFFVPVIMHAGVFHILFNLFLQLRIGLGFEVFFGTWRMAVIYIVSGLGGNLFSCLVSPNTLSVGASGALLGMIGARISHIVSIWRRATRHQHILEVVQLSILLLFALIIGASKYVDWGAHLGGAIVGVLMGLIVFNKEFQNKNTGRAALAVSSVLLGIFFVVGIVCFWTVVPVHKID